VGDESAEDTSPVTGQESDHELGLLGVGVLGGSEDVRVESLDGVLEGGELDHGVRNLSHPKRRETLVEAVPALSVHDLGPSFTGSLGEGTGLGGLHTDLKSFPGAEEAIGNDLSAGGGDEETDGLVLVGLLTKGTSVDILEHFVETEFTETLSTITNKGWEPSEGEALEAFSGVDLGETITNGFVHGRHSLTSALNDIERAHDSVSETA